MSYKNSLKLLISNFNLVWKQLLYMLIICVICFGIGYSIFIPTINLLKAEGVIAEISSIFEVIYTSPRDVITACRDAVSHLLSVLSLNFGKIWLSLFGAIIFAKIIFSILKYVSFYTVTNIMHMKMTSFVEVGYTRTLISNFSSAIRYAFARYIYDIPFDLIKYFIVIIYLKSATSVVSIVVGLFVCCLLIITISGIEISLFAGHATVMIENSGVISAFKAFLIGNKTVFKNYWRVLSNAIVISLTIVVMNLFLGVFTIGAGLLITIPASIIFKCIFDLAAYLGAKGERYYIAENTIAVTKDIDPENKR